VRVTTRTFPRNRTKSPTLLIAATRRMLLDRAWKAFLPPVQKLHPYIAERREEEKIADHPCL